MSDTPKNETITSSDPVTGEQPEASEEQSTEASKAKEIGGRDGPDPTRYGDWEKAGRCIDF